MSKETLEQEAERLYPKEVVIGKENSDRFTFNEIADIARNAHITCARQYMGEIEKLKDVLHIDQTGLAAGLAEVNKIVEGYRWVTEGRGPYEWNDDRYKEEVGNMLDNISEAATKALNSSGAIAHSVCCGKEGRMATMEGIGYIKIDAHDHAIDSMGELLMSKDGEIEGLKKEVAYLSEQLKSCADDYNNLQDQANAWKEESGN